MRLCPSRAAVIKRLLQLASATDLAGPFGLAGGLATGEVTRSNVSPTQAADQRCKAHRAL